MGTSVKPNPALALCRIYSGPHQTPVSDQYLRDLPPRGPVRKENKTQLSKHIGVKDTLLSPLHRPLIGIMIAPSHPPSSLSKSKLGP